MGKCRLGALDGLPAAKRSDASLGASVPVRCGRASTGVPGGRLFLLPPGKLANQHICRVIRVGVSPLPSRSSFRTAQETRKWSPCDWVGVTVKQTTTEPTINPGSATLV